MKKYIPAAIITSLVLFTACEKKEPIHKESVSAIPDATNVTSFTETKSENDSFHPKSKYESSRKTKLTNFGRISYTPKVSTPDIDSMNEMLGTGHGHTTVSQHEMIPMKCSQITIGDFTEPKFPFDYENDIRSLKRLKKEHNLDALIAPYTSTLDKAKALTIYAHEYFQGLREPDDNEFSKTGPSASTIAKMKKEGIGGTSIHYAALLCQFGTACGYVTRIVSMHTVDESGKILAHNVCEMYLSPFRKWVVFDPYSKATYYLRGKLPQSALELRELMLNNMYRDLKPIVSFGDFTDVVSVRENLLPRYKYLSILRRNDFSNTNITWDDLSDCHLVWEDKSSPVSSGSFEKVKGFDESGVQYIAHDPIDFNWPINQVKFDIERLKTDMFRLHLDAMAPNFSEFRISLDNEQYEDALPSKSNTFDFKISDFELNVWAVNELGGVTSFASAMVTRL